MALGSRKLSTLVATWSVSAITPIIDVRVATRTDATMAENSTEADNSWMYQLTLSRPLPTVNLANTIASRMLSETSYQRIVHFLKVRYRIVSLCIRLSGVSFGVLLFVNSNSFTLLL